MTDRTSISFRAASTLADDLEEASEALEVPKSELLRVFASQGLERLEPEDLEHLTGKHAVESIKREENLRQRRAWYHSEVCSQLWKAWNGGLEPDRCEEYLEGRRREAAEVHEDDDLVAFLERGLEAYVAAWENDEEALLGMFTNGRRGRGDVQAEPPTASETEDPPESVLSEANRRPREERIEEAVAIVRYSGNGYTLEDVEEGIRDDVRERLERDDRDAPPGGDA